VIFLLFFTMFL